MNPFKVTPIQLRIFLFFIVFLLTNACENPFATRDVEEPVRSRSNREIPSEPQTVLKNLQTSFTDRDVASYMNCLTTKPELFSFIPDEFVKENNAGAFENWSLESERNYMNQINNFVPIDSLIRLSFEEISSEVYADSAFLRREYTLILNHTYQGNVPRKAEGQAYFWLFKDEGYWYIRKWSDFGTTSEPSWSSIKAGFGK